MPTAAAKKAAAPKAAPKEASLGTFAFAKETPNTHRFEQEVEEGRNKLQYVSKETLETLGNPEAIEVIIRAA
jgi:hypothetical protein